MDFFCVSPAHEWAACEMGDCIGMESCVDLQKNQEAALGCRGGRRRQGSEVMKRSERREFPPPLPTLAPPDNLPSSHMTWAMRRYYTGDGRLVIREEKVRHREYLRAHRSGGRLTLQLVRLGDEEDEEEEEREYINNAEADPYHPFGDDDEIVGSDRVAEETSTAEVAAGGGGGNWYGHASVRSNPCMVGMDVPAPIMPVHT